MPTKKKKKKPATANDLVRYMMDDLVEYSMARAQENSERRIDDWVQQTRFHIGHNPVAQWFKVIIRLQLNLENYKDLVKGVALLFERVCDAQHLYYARYTTLDKSTVEISALTTVSQ